MIKLEPPFRVAVQNDGAALAQLANHAGAGMPLHLWTGLAQPDEDPWAIGAARILSQLEVGTIIVADEGKGVFAVLVGHPIGADPKPIDELPPMFIPLQELENEALDSWYVFILSVLPGRREQGVGGKLLGIAEKIADDQAKRRMSLIVADSNQRARHLYKRTGYNEVTQRPIVKNGWTTDSQYWVLMVKDLG